MSNRTRSYPSLFIAGIKSLRVTPTLGQVKGWQSDGMVGCKINSFSREALLFRGVGRWTTKCGEQWLAGRAAGWVGLKGLENLPCQLPV
jgi:hypothetical protein